jgi:hypothetical protein
VRSVFDITQVEPQSPEAQARRQERKGTTGEEEQDYNSKLPRVPYVQPELAETYTTALAELVSQTTMSHGTAEQRSSIPLLACREQFALHLALRYYHLPSSVPDGYQQVWQAYLREDRQLMQELEAIRLCAAEAIEAMEKRAETLQAELSA